tara:strand:- start:1202 stop:1528 length:327 start_codon:yes stop_codon:yes gene_type:complete
MKNPPTPEQLAKIPRLYETDNIQTKDKIIHLHFSFLSCGWYIAEFDGQDTLLCFAILNGNLAMAEWGMVSYEFLRRVNINGQEVENDINWVSKPASEVDIICLSRGWI